MGWMNCPLKWTACPPREIHVLKRHIWTKVILRNAIATHGRIGESHDVDDARKTMIRRRMLENTTRVDAGASLRNTMKAIAKQGVCQDPLWPYIISRFAVKPSNSSYAAGASHKITQYISVPQDQASIETLLSKNFVIVFGFLVYNSFYAIAGNGKLRMPSKGETPIGGHAVVLVGYDRSQRLFIVRNSWGTNWGDKGHFYMPYEYVLDPARAFDFWVINAAV